MTTPTTDKPTREGCYRVEYDSGKWCWMIVMRHTPAMALCYDSMDPLLDIKGRSLRYGFLGDIADGMRYIEVHPPEGEV